MNSIAFRLNLIKERIANANLDNHPVQLMGVSKTRPVDEIRKAYEAGLKCFGENRIQEALPKLAALQDCDIEWHFIGRIQSNKVKKLATNFKWVHSVDNEKIAQQLNDHCPKDNAPLNICIQVNIDADNNKAGINPEEIEPLANFIKTLPNLTLRGLMTVPQIHTRLEDDQKSYRHLKILYDNLKQKGYPLDTLSMGMSKDLEAAVAEGATIVRIGKNLFGPFDD